MILVDAGPLVALCDRRDARAPLARRHLKKLASQRFAVCEAVLVETCFHLAEHFHRQRLRTLLEELDAAPTAETGSLEFRGEVFEWLARYADHDPDWSDACLAVLSGRHPDCRVWTYDREFRSIWRRPDGSAIALAFG